jgi:hypothetical protein
MRMDPPPSAPTATGHSPAATAAAEPLERAVMRVEAGGVDADLVHVGLADDQRALRAQPRHDGGVGGRRLA